MKSQVKTRSSVDRKTTYQVEYKEIQKGKKSEYRLRRGARGAWTKWYQGNGIELLIYHLGFTSLRRNLLNDFLVEVYFSRGEIKMTPEMVVGLLESKAELSNYFYAKITKHSDKYWVIPANAVKTEEHHRWLKKFFSKFV